MWDGAGNGEPVSVVDMLKAELLEHLTRLEVVINDAGGDVLVLLGQPLRHKLNDQ